METNPAAQAPIKSIELLGEKHAAELPDFCEREELWLAWTGAEAKSTHMKLRAAAAAIGLCTRIGRRVPVTYEDCDCKPAKYGGKVYSWLREQGVEADVVMTIGFDLVLWSAGHRGPREEAVADRSGFTTASAGAST